MDTINISEQWKLDGDCSKCRRSKYCNKDCKAHNHRRQAYIHRAFCEAMIKTILKKEK